MARFLILLFVVSRIVSAQILVQTDGSGDTQYDALVEDMLAQPPVERVQMLKMIIEHALLPPERGLLVANIVDGQYDVATNPTLRGETAFAVAMAAKSVGHLTRAKGAVRDTFTAAQATNDKVLEFNAVALSAQIDQEEGNVANAARSLLDFLDALEEGPEDSAITLRSACLVQLAQLASQSKCIAASIDLYRRAMLIEAERGEFSSAARLSQQIAGQFEKAGDIVSATANATQAMHLASKGGVESVVFQTTCYRLGLERLSEEGRPRAIRQLEDLVAAADPDGSDFSHAQFTLFRMHLAAGNLSTAEEHFQKATRRDAASTESALSARVDRAMALHGSGRSNEALEWLESILSDTADTPNEAYALALETSARILQEIGDNEEANIRLGEAVRLLKTLSIRDQLARSAFMAGWSGYQEKKRTRLASLQRQKAVHALQTYMAIGAGVLCVLVVFWLCRRSSRRRFDELTRRSLEELKEELDVNGRALRDEMETRQKLELELERNRKAEAIAALTSGVAHDFNNLMTVVISSNELIRMTAADALGDRELRMLDESTHAARSGAEITSQLLALTRRRSAEQKLINVKDLFDEIEGLLQRTVGDRIRLELECLDEFACVFTDRTQLTSALINLCCNARDASEGRGAVTIRADRPYGTESTDPIVISVIDEGVGMSRDQIGMACKPLYTTKPEGKGTGLGLSVVEQFVRESGGSLTIASRLSQGTTVSIKLPSSEQQPDPTESDLELQKLDGVSVIVVDDKNSVLKSVERTLKVLGCEVRAVTSADEALESIDRNGPPDVLLSDVRMPGTLDGLELAEWARKNHNHLPIVLMTGYSDSSTGGFPVLPKPFTMQELSLALSAVIEPDVR